MTKASTTLTTKLDTPANLPMLGDEEAAFVDVEAAPLPTDADITSVRKLAELQVDLMTRIAKGEAVMARLQAYLKDVTDRQLPLSIKALGIRGFDMADGSAVSVEDFVAVGISKPNKIKALEWLEQAGKGDLIKHVITISFGKGEDAWAKKFLRDMAQRKKPLAAVQKDDVNFQTLNAFVREEFRNLRAKGIDPYTKLPQDLLGIYEGSRAVVKLSPVAELRIQNAVEAVLQREDQTKK